jgi:hypothetical protein
MDSSPAELHNDAKQVHGNPSHANTLALIGIGNALLQIAEQLGRLDHLRTVVGSLDEISDRPQFRARPVHSRRLSGQRNERWGRGQAAGRETEAERRRSRGCQCACVVAPS